MAKKKEAPKTAEKKEGKSGKSWFKRGEEGFEKKRQLDVVNKMKREKAITRFYLKDGESANIVFSDENPLLKMAA